MSIFEIDLGVTIWIALSAVAATVMGYTLLALAMADAIPRWLRGAPLAVGWLIGLAPPALGLALDDWSLHGLFFYSLAPGSGLFIATLAARGDSY